jgi:hypothetical protein
MRVTCSTQNSNKEFELKQQSPADEKYITSRQDQSMQQGNKREGINLVIDNVVAHEVFNFSVNLGKSRCCKGIEKRV